MPIVPRAAASSEAGPWCLQRRSMRQTLPRKAPHRLLLQTFAADSADFPAALVEFWQLYGNAPRVLLTEPY
eukprot:938413-Rhodomonas_salina.1